jgi:hypothetical protein
MWPTPCVFCFTEEMLNERERCAKIAEEAPFMDYNVREQIAAAIRGEL